MLLTRLETTGPTLQRLLLTTVIPLTKILQTPFTFLTVRQRIKKHVCNKESYIFITFDTTFGQYTNSRKCHLFANKQHNLTYWDTKEKRISAFICC